MKRLISARMRAEMTHWKLHYLAGLWSLKRRRKKSSDKVRSVKPVHRRRAHVTSRRMRGSGGSSDSSSASSFSSAAAVSSSSLRHSCRSLTTSHTAHTPTTVTHCSLQNTPTLMQAHAAKTRVHPGRGAAAIGRKISKARRKKSAVEE
jgi:hypothetical protein